MKELKLKTFNKNLCAVLAAITLLIFSGVAFADNPPACVRDAANKITGAIWTADQKACITEPATMKVKVNHMYMCYSKPRAPTTSVDSNQKNSAGTLGVCAQQLWPNPVSRATSEFSVVRGQSNSLVNAGGNFRGVVGKQNFTYFTVYLDPYFKMQGIQEFDYDVVDNEGNVGRFCWTLAAEVYANRTPVSTNDTVKCGATLALANAGVGELKTVFNSIGDTTGEHANFTIDGATIDAYLIKSNGRLISSSSADVSNSVSEILAHVTLPAGTYMESCSNKQNGTLRVSLQWKVSEAMEFKAADTLVGGRPHIHTVAPSEFYLMVVPDNGGTCH